MEEKIDDRILSCDEIYKRADLIFMLQRCRASMPSCAAALVASAMLRRLRPLELF